MRRPAVPAAIAAIVVATGCPSNDSSSPPGKEIGQPCSAARECRAGLVCAVGSCDVPWVPAQTCPAPIGRVSSTIYGPSTDPDPTGTLCMTSGTAIRAPVVSAQPLGELKVGDSRQFNVPAATTSFSILSQEVGTTAVDSFLLQGYPLPNAVVPTDILEPGSPPALFFSDMANIPVDDRNYPDVTGLLAYFGGFTPSMGTFTAPNTSAGLDLVRSAGGLPAGPWYLTVNDWARECQLLFPGACTGVGTGGYYDVQVITHAGGLRSPGTLDLEIYLATDPYDAFSGVSSVSVAYANPQIARMIADIGEYFAQAGICIGTVTLHDLPSWARNRLAPGGHVSILGNPPCDDLSQLFTLALAPSAAVHLFLADALDAGQPDGSGRIVLGVDGAIPGPSGVPGTITSGAIVGLFDLLGYEREPGACSGPRSISTCGTDLVAYVAAHEAGHWLGLYHTTEMSGDLFDPLSDTSRCPCLSCAPISTRPACSELRVATDPQVMEASFCTSSGDTYGGARNLMFWLLDDSISAGELTSEQGEVMRLNPAVH